MNHSLFPPILHTSVTTINNLPRSNFLLRLLLTGIVFFLARQIYLSTTTSATTTTATTTSATATTPPSSEIDDSLIQTYTTVFQNLITDGFLTVDSTTLAVGRPFPELTTALNLTGVKSAKSTNNNLWLPFRNHTFDFQFSTHSGLDSAPNPGEFSSELARTLKPNGFLIIHTKSRDSYSLNSLLDLFDSFKLIRSRHIHLPHRKSQPIREIVLKKQNRSFRRLRQRQKLAGSCSVPAYKKELIQNAEPLKPWTTIQRNSKRYETLETLENLENVKNLDRFRYLPLMADISFKTRYIYIDVGARSYRSSIGSWFMTRYPQQDKPFEIFAIEADKTFHDEYKSREGVTVVPYAAWVRNESLFFEINRAPRTGQVGQVRGDEERGRGMGRVQSARTSSGYIGDMNKIEGFDFAKWVKDSFTERDFVVVKMDVDGSEFDLVAEMVKTGAVCLVDEMFVECYGREGESERDWKYEKVYRDCFELFSLLREKGVLVHQWS